MIANGNSMRPFIYDNDMIELEIFCSKPVKGDIVLVKCSEERYVIHRIIKIKNGSFYLRGDAQLHYEGPFTHQNILGKITKSFHKGKSRNHHQGMWFLAGQIWINTYKIIRFVKLIVFFIRKSAGRFFYITTGTNFSTFIQNHK